MHAKSGTQLCHWLVLQDIAARRVLECNTHTPMVSQLHQECRCVGHAVALLHRSIRQVAHEVILLCAFAFAGIHPPPRPANRCCPKQAALFDPHEKVHCTVKAIGSANVVCLIVGLVESCRITPQLGSSLRNRSHSCKHFKTIQVTGDCQQLRIAQDFCDQLPAATGISKLVHGHHRTDAGRKTLDASAIA